jgi:transaldolase
MSLPGTRLERAVFLDRDGVINKALVREGRPYPPNSADELVLVPGAAESLRRLKRLGFRLVVVTNQPDVARGTQTRAAVAEIHRKIAAAVPVDEFLVCYNDDADGCDCRKPRPGLLLAAADKFGLDLDQCFLIGDRWRDVDAGHAAGCTTILIDYGYRERTPSSPPAKRVSSLAGAVEWISTLRSGRSQMAASNQLRIKLFADGADKAAMLGLYADPRIQGFTTNPTLMRKAGITDYLAFAKDILASIPDRPLSLEVFADEFPEMERQAHKIAALGENVYVKIPVTNTKAEPSLELICRLSRSGVKLNITALLTLGQVRDVTAALRGGAPSYVSVFAGRIADTGRDPVPLMAAAVEMVSVEPQIELIWASPRELLNIFQADAVGCHIITATSDILKKLSLVGKDLHDYSLDTVRMFYDDARYSGFQL